MANEDGRYARSHPDPLPGGSGTGSSPETAEPLPPPVDLRLTVLPEHACPYLPDRTARFRAFATQHLSPALYHDFMDAGFRRSGQMVYQPICDGCRSCIPLRVPVATFHPDKSQRRCSRRNQDLVVTVGPPSPSAEKFDLYRRYVLQWHGNRTAAGEERNGELTQANFEAFLYETPVATVEFAYRRPTDGRLVAVGICDVSARSLSSVYFYFDPAEASRSVGTFGVLREIGWAAEQGLGFYYLGYWVPGCPAMQYKSRFQHCEVLTSDGKWAGLLR